MKTIIRTYEVYPLSELAENAQRKAYNQWLENFDYAWSSDNKETLKAFCNLFKVVCTHWEYDAYTYNFRCTTKHSEIIEELKGQRLATYIINNFGNALYPPKNYWKNRKKRNSHVFTNNSCPLTGYYLDDDILQPIYDFLEKPEANTTFLCLIRCCLDDFFTSCRDDYAAQQSEENFKNESYNNEWEYLSDGKQFSE